MTNHEALVLKLATMKPERAVKAMLMLGWRFDLPPKKK